MYKRMNNS